MGNVWRIARFLVGVLLLVTPAAAQLDDTCVVSALNRTAPVRADGTWVLPNVPANIGLVRVRATCVGADGTTRSGQSDFFQVPANGVIEVADIVFDDPQPVPDRLVLDTPTTELTQVGETVQLTATAVFPDGKSTEVTAGTSGTTYVSSNPAVLSVTADGLVTALASGVALISATHEGTLGLVSLRVVTSADSDGDGVPDDVEIANGLDPNDSTDAFGDPDADGLSTRDELDVGLDPFDPDTDGDGLLDGDEATFIGTNPLLFDTDGDQISDGLEIQSGSNPLDPTSFNLAPILEAFVVEPASFTLVFNTAVGEASRRLAVTGALIDGTEIDLRRKSFGTNYISSDLTVASFGAEDGRVFAGQDGTAVITVENSGFSATTEVTVTTFSPTALSFLRLSGHPNGVAVGGDFAYVASGGAGLHVVNVASPQFPFRAATVNTPGNANDVRLDGSLVYVADDFRGLQIVDVEVPQAPVRIGSLDTPGTATDLAVENGMVYVADGTSGLQVIDASDPSAPLLVGSLDTPGNARGIDVENGLVAIADAHGGVHAVDVSIPSQPILLGSVHTRNGFSRAADVVLRDRLAYVADGAGSLGGLKVVDLREPSVPVVVGASSDSFGLVGVALEGNYVLTADYFFANAVPIFDVGFRFPAFSAVLDFSRSPSFRDDNGNGIAVDRGFVYLVGTQRIRDNGTWGWGGLHIGRWRVVQDNEGVAPDVRLIAPQAGDQVRERRQITIQAEASDDIAVVSVRFLVDGEVVGEDFDAPFETQLTVPVDTTTLTVGAVATDLGANEGVAEEVTVEVVPDDKPVVELLSPAPDVQPVEGATVTLTANASDDVTIAGVEFFVDGISRGTVAAPPYQLDFTIPLGTESFLVDAVASDDVGQTATASRTVAVQPDQPPTVIVLEPLDGGEVVAGGRVRISAGADDDIGVTRVRFLIDGSFHGEDFEAPYESEVTAPGTVGTSFQISAVAEDTRGRQARADVSVVTIPDPGTSVVGTVLLPEEGGPAEAASVVSGGITGLTDASGRFLLEGVPTVAGGIVVQANLARADGTFLVGFSEDVTPVPEGVTEVGEIVLFPGFPNGNGGFETGDFTGYTVAGNTAVLSSLGPLTPPEGGFMGFLSTGSGAVDFTTSTLETDPISIPAGVSFLALDFNFLSNEFPTFVGSIFNDMLVVRLNLASGTSEETLLASVNTSSFVEAAGTGFNGMTGFDTIRIDVSDLAGSLDPCTLTFEIRVFDEGDTAVDSAALIDNLRFE